MKQVIQKRDYAFMWWDVAETSGSQRDVGNSGVRASKEAKESIIKEMTPAQIEKAQELARECIRKEYKGC